jgi:hypothetical protein
MSEQGAQCATPGVADQSVTVSINLEQEVHFNTLVLHNATAPLSGPAKRLVELADAHLNQA